MGETIKILGIAGSLRKGSYNRAALREALELVPQHTNLEIFDVGGIPLFNQDDEQNPPEKVKKLKEKIRDADAILFVTPEYNYSVSGVLKNAIDWASRPYGESAWEGKPAAVMGASISMTGTARAQLHLRQMFVFLNMYPLNKPQVMVSNAEEKFDKEGKLRDRHTKEKISELMEALSLWAIRFQNKVHVTENNK